MRESRRGRSSAAATRAALRRAARARARSGSRGTFSGSAPRASARGMPGRSGSAAWSVGERATSAALEIRAALRVEQRAVGRARDRARRAERRERARRAPSPARGRSRGGAPRARTPARPARATRTRTAVAGSRAASGSRSLRERRVAAAALRRVRRRARGRRRASRRRSVRAKPRSTKRSPGSSAQRRRPRRGCARSRARPARALRADRRRVRAALRGADEQLDGRCAPPSGGASGEPARARVEASVGASASGGGEQRRRARRSSTSTPCRFTAHARAGRRARRRASPWLCEPADARARPARAAARPRRRRGAARRSACPSRRCRSRASRRRGRPRGAAGRCAACAAAPRAPRASSASRSASRPAPVVRRDAHDRRAARGGLREQRAHLVLARARHVSLSTEIALGERDDAALDAEQLADREVLARLRHHALVGGDDEQHEVDARRARHHRAHERFVPGHVDHAESRTPRGSSSGAKPSSIVMPRAFSSGRRSAVDAGQRAHERGLAVIDVPGGAEDEARRQVVRRADIWPRARPHSTSPPRLPASSGPISSRPT